MNPAISTPNPVPVQSSTEKQPGHVRKATSPPQLQSDLPPSILHIKFWYDKGKVGEINITGTNLVWGDFIETQYYYMREYFAKVGAWMKLEAYQANICALMADGTLKIIGTYDKVVFSARDAYRAGQYCTCNKEAK